MKRIAAIISSAILTCLVSGCSSGVQLSGVSEDPTYGYNQENPIKVGGVKEHQGPENERRYLEALRGPTGQKISYNRVGSCCPFDAPDGFLGGGMLDIYEVTYEGVKTPVRLYLNMYDRDRLLAPRGFSY